MNNSNNKKLLGKKINRLHFEKKENSKNIEYYKELNDINVNQINTENIHNYKTMLLNEIIENEKLNNNFLQYEEDKKLILTVIQKESDDNIKHSKINKSESN